MVRKQIVIQLIGFAMAALWGLGGCSQQATNSDPGQPAPENPQPSAPTDRVTPEITPPTTSGEPRTTTSSLSYDPTSSATAAEIGERVKGQNQFGFKLYNELIAKEAGGNVCLSPLSIQAAFALLYPGTNSSQPSGQEIAKALGFDPDPVVSGFHRKMKGYLLHLASIFANPPAGARFEWKLVNKVWVDQIFELAPTYLDTVKVNYDAGVAVMDFRSSEAASEQARKTINRFVEEQTKSLIKDLMPPGSVDTDTSVVLTNSVYLLADWASPFKPESTYDGFFNTLAGQKVTAKMMNQTGHFDYLDSGTYQALRLPYIGNELAMIIVLPKTRDSFSAVERSIDATVLASQIGAGLKGDYVHVGLPKFQFKWGSKSLNDALKALGLVTPFTADRNHFPDLLMMNGKPLDSAQWQVWIQDVQHQAEIIVDEKGTEAAAATSISVGTTTSVPPPPKEFVVDRPALFYLVDTEFNSVLFMGRLTDPSAS